MKNHTIYLSNYSAKACDLALELLEVLAVNATAKVTTTYSDMAAEAGYGWGNSKVKGKKGNIASVQTGHALGIINNVANVLNLPSITSLAVNKKSKCVGGGFKTNNADDVLCRKAVFDHNWTAVEFQRFKAEIGHYKTFSTQKNTTEAYINKHIAATLRHLKSTGVTGSFDKKACMKLLETGSNKLVDAVFLSIK